MHNEEIFKRWNDYIDGNIKYNILGGLPYLFKSTHCGTCSHWYLLCEDSIHYLACEAPKDYDKIIKGIKGEIVRAYKEDGVVKDVYSDFCFYGWCKRFPPSRRTGYSIISIRTLFTRLIRHIPQHLFEYSFPIMPHDERCGEWQKAPWVDERLEKSSSRNIDR